MTRDRLADYIFARWSNLFARFAEHDREPAPSDSCRTLDGRCDGSCERRRDARVPS